MGLASIWEQKGIERGRSQGIEQGIEQGIMLGKEELVARLLRRQIGDITEDATARLEHLTAGQLDELGEALLDFKNVSDLEQWLTQHLA